MRRKRYWGVVVLLLLPALKALSQAPVSPKVELFAGAELHYRDIFYTKMYGWKSNSIIRTRNR